MNHPNEDGTKAMGAKEAKESTFLFKKKFKTYLKLMEVFKQGLGISSDHPASTGTSYVPQCKTTFCRESNFISAVTKTPYMKQ